MTEEEDMFEVKITKYATIKVEAGSEDDAIQKVGAMDLKCKWAECWECKQLLK